MEQDKNTPREDETLSEESKQKIIEKILKEDDGEQNEPVVEEKKPTEEKGPLVEKEKKPTHTHKNILDNIPGVSISKTKDENTLIDVHVSNPLKRVVDLLEEIKKQKAFSFTLKGSLGIMGVFLTLSFFGIFGGEKILCQKGLQTRVGMIKALQLTEESTDPNIPWTKAMLQKVFFLQPTTMRQRVVLLTDNEPPIHLITLLKHKPEALNGQDVVVTGNYNSCSHTLSLQKEESLESL